MNFNTKRPPLRFQIEKKWFISVRRTNIEVESDQNIFYVRQN